MAQCIVISDNNANMSYCATLLVESHNNVNAEQMISVKGNWKAIYSRFPCERDVWQTVS